MIHPPPRKPSRRERAWAVWLALPEIVRLAVILLAFVALAWMSG